MALKKVDAGPLPETGEFKKLNAIGDKVVGKYVSYAEKEGKYGTENQYTFRTKEGLQTISANYDLDRQLKKALKDDELKPGYTVMIKYEFNHPPRNPGQSGMKGHGVYIDDGVAAPPPPSDDIDI